MMVLDDTIGKNAVIKVVGVGGAGGNAINTMIEEHIEGVEFIAVNTDLQALSINYADTKIQIGETRTRGLGAGSNPSVGREAAIESQSVIQETLMGADMVFVTAGMGGGTGTGAAPVVAEIARKNGSLTVGVVTKPFGFEGKRRRRQAEEGLDVLRSCVDTLIVIPNERLLQVVGESATLEDSFKKVDGVLLNAVRSISELIVKPGFINTDFADVCTVMSNKGIALMGTGVASGNDRATEAAEMAINSPLLDDITIKGATSVLLNITAPRTVSLAEINTAARLIEEEASDDVHLIFGHVFVDDPECEDFKVTVIATGFEDVYQEEAERNTGEYHQANPHSHSGNYGANYGGAKTPAAYAPSQFMPQKSAHTPSFNSPQAAYIPANANPSASYQAQPKSNTPQLDAVAEGSFYPPQLNREPANSYAPQAAPQKQSSLLPHFDETRSSQENNALKGSLAEVAARPMVQGTTSGLTPEEEQEIDTPAFMRKSSSKKYFMD